MLRWSSYAATILIVTATVVASLVYGGAAVFGPPLLLFAAVPLLDVLVGLDRQQPGEGHDAPAWLWRNTVRLWVPIQLALLAYGIPHVVASDGPLWERALQVAGLGIATGGVGITFAHEMMHRSTRIDRALAEVLMASVGYTWFCVEHVLGHHRNVATPDDPATSRLGESLYAFLPRTVVGGLRSAIALERARCQRRGIGPLDPRHRLSRYALGLALLEVALAAALGPIGWAVWAGQALVAVLLLEIVNYLEHYGLQRWPTHREGAGAGWERVRPEHSWNSAHAISNRFLANLARHADHHANANRPWEQLRHLEDAPQLPTGYGAMLVLALVPPLWFAVMDPRVRRWNARGGAEDEPVQAVGA